MSRSDRRTIDLDQVLLDAKGEEIREIDVDARGLPRQEVVTPDGADKPVSIAKTRPVTLKALLYAALEREPKDQPMTLDDKLRRGALQAIVIGGGTRDDFTADDVALLKAALAPFPVSWVVAAFKVLDPAALEKARK